LTNPILTLNNGVVMPAVGFGVFRAAPEETTRAVSTALETGYRLIDTAAAYMNEEQVGVAVRASGLPRDKVFVESKLWISDYTYDGAMHGFERSLRKLGLDHIDLYLLHQPAPEEFDRTLGAWKALSEILKDGRARAVGVSNFNEDLLKRAIDETGLVPAVNQVELHPFFTQKSLTAFHAEHGIVTQAWSPIGGVNRYFIEDPKPEDDPLTHPVTTGIAEAHGKSPAQVMLRWHLALGHAVIPKSVKPERIRQNFDVFDFELSAEEIAAIDALDTGKRGGPDPASISTKTYDFKIPD
jgi:2,5-diketo-D-gluconate reductase A